MPVGVPRVTKPKLSGALAWGARELLPNTLRAQGGDRFGWRTLSLENALELDAEAEKFVDKAVRL